MGAISVLDPVTASQIAAGEVIERPASAVKELVENALDAQASRVVIETKGGGSELISVSDDGCGMGRDDAEKAFSRHATSKIRAVEDIYSVTSLGFRGEALPSIAAVSKVELITRTHGDVAGTRVRVEGGAILCLEEAALAPGTTVRVRSLFFNTPARRKFMVSPRAENAAIADTVTRLALSHPEVGFRLIQEGREALLTTGQGDLLQTASEVFGHDCAQCLIPLIDTGNLGIQGFIGDRNLARASRRRQYFFINRRPVFSPLLSQAVEEGTRGFTPQGTRPFVLLLLRMDPGTMDVNVHPAKAQVRYSDDRRVFKSVLSAVRQSLQRPEGISERLTAVMEERQAYPEVSAADMTQIDIFRSLPEGALPDIDVIGQVASTYIVGQSRDGLYLIDQHAAHERVVFERLLSASEGLVGQELLLPVTVELGPGELSAWLGSKSYLESLGIGFDHLGGRMITVRSVPSPLVDSVSAPFLLELTDRLLDSLIPGQSKDHEEALKALAACHASVRAGKRLSLEEMRRLILDLGATGTPYFCPHGRPTVIKMSWSELERRFGRR